MNLTFQTHEPPTGGLSRLRRRLRQVPRDGRRVRRYRPAVSAALLAAGIALVALSPFWNTPEVAPPMPDVSHPLLRAAGGSEARWAPPQGALMVETGNVRAYWLAPSPR